MSTPLPTHPALISTRPASPSDTRERLVRRVKLLSWLSLAWMTVEGAVAILAGAVAGSIALVGFGLDSVIEGLAGAVIIWRFTGARSLSEAAGALSES